MARPFVILALPRSRTAWLSHWLSYPPKRVGHDTAIVCNSISDFTDQFVNGMDGTVETIAVVGWRLLQQIVPGLRLIVVRRPVDEVRKSLDALGVDQTVVSLETQALMLDEVAKQPGVRCYEFHELDSYETVSDLWTTALDREFDAAWWLHWRALNVQINIGDRLEQVSARRGAMLALHRDVVTQSEALRCRMC